MDLVDISPNRVRGLLCILFMDLFGSPESLMHNENSSSKDVYFKGLSIYLKSFK
jgi:hypothetical protein